MSAVFSSPHIVDLILAVLILEITVLAIRAPAGSFWPRLTNLAIAALPGALLLLALRAALSHAGWPWVALCLAASFPAHLVDLARRPP